MAKPIQSELDLVLLPNEFSASLSPSLSSLFPSQSLSLFDV